MRPPPPGLKMTRAQWYAYWALFSRACIGQGWTRENGWRPVEIEAKRIELMRDLGFQSSKDIDRKGDFDRWKARCLFLAGDLNGAIEDDDASIGARRRKVAKCLEALTWVAVYVAHPKAYLDTIFKGKFDWNPGFRARLEVLSDDPIPRTDGTESVGELTQCLMTLTRCAYAQAKKAKDSPDQMKAKAKADQFASDEGAAIAADCRCPKQRQGPEVPEDNIPF